MLTLDKTNPNSKDYLAQDTGYVLKERFFGSNGSSGEVFSVHFVRRDKPRSNELSIWARQTEKSPDNLAVRIWKSQQYQRNLNGGTPFYDNLSLDKPSWFPNVELRDPKVIVTYEEMTPGEKSVFLNTLISKLQE